MIQDFNLFCAHVWAINARDPCDGKKEIPVDSRLKNVTSRVIVSEA